MAKTFNAIGSLMEANLRAVLPSKRQIIVWGILVLLALFLLAGSAFAQLDGLQIQNGAGVSLKQWAGGIAKLKCGANLTCTLSGPPYVITMAGATTATAGTASTVALRDASGRLTSKRFIADGAALVNTDFAVHADWGVGAAIATITGTDQGWQGTVTAAGVPGASPTLILTFKDGTWTNAPVCISKMTGGSGTITDLSDTASATTLTITFNGTPVAASTYIISAVCMGR